MTTLGKAFIEVHADTKPFAREIAPELKAILDAVGEKGNKRAFTAGKKIGDGLDDGIGARFPILRRRFSTLAGMIDNLRDRIDKRGGLRQSFENLAKGNFILTRLFGAFALKVGGVIRGVARLGKGLLGLAHGIDLVFQGVVGLATEGFKTLIGVGGDFARVQSTLALGFTKIGMAIGAAVAEMVAAAPAIAAVVVVIAALSAAIGVLFFALATVVAPFAALINLLLTVPTVIGLALAVIGPLILALHGLGDAFKVLNEKDPKKFAEGLKALPPVMRQLVGILRPFRDRFAQLRDTIQKAFFEPIFRQLGPALNQMLSTLLVGFSAIASSLGEVVAQVLKVFQSPEFNGMLVDIMLQFADFIRANAGVLAQLIVALGAMAQAALPVVLVLLQKFTDFMLQFASWIMGAITDGRFEHWLQIGITALTTIWGLVKALIGLFVALFGKLQSGGNDFLKIITDAINKFTAWVKSPQGSHALENMVVLAKLIAKAFELALGYIINMVNKVSALIDMAKWLNDHTGIFNVAGQLLKLGSSFSGGGVVPSDQVAMVHKGEPILDPANSVTRNRAILSQAGMLDVLEPQGTIVYVYVGNEQLDARTDYRIARSNQKNALALTGGVRI